MDNPAILFAIGAFLVIGSIVAYVVLMIFLPEWVGITGKVARDAQKSHQGESPPVDKFDEGLDKWHDPESKEIKK